MQNKTVLIYSGIVIVLTLFIGFILHVKFQFMPMKITGLIEKVSIDEPEKRRQLQEIYDVNFVFDNTSTNTAKIYLPQYHLIEEDSAAYYADLFGFDRDNVEFDDYYLYKKDTASLYINKYSSYVRYENYNLTISDERVDEPFIVEKAKQFINTTLQMSDYNKFSVSFDGKNYTVKLMNSLNKYNNYAFPSVLIFNANGDLLSIDFYYFDYEMIASVDLKTMKQAFNELPVNFEEGINVDLKTCKLVYIYEESIVQPAFLFEGEITSGNTFQCFVKAAKYSN